MRACLFGGRVRLKRGFLKSASNFAVAAHQSHVVAAVKIDALISVVFEFQRDDEETLFRRGADGFVLTQIWLVFQIREREGQLRGDCGGVPVGCGELPISVDGGRYGFKFKGLWTGRAFSQEEERADYDAAITTKISPRRFCDGVARINFENAKPSCLIVQLGSFIYCTQMTSYCQGSMCVVYIR